MEASVIVPQMLIRDELNGKPYFYRGYRRALSGEITYADLMGSSELQWLIVSTVLRYLYKALPEDAYEIATNEAGLHLDKGSNVATDIAIYRRTDVSFSLTDTHYSSKPPVAVIEVDVQIEAESEPEIEYVVKKTRKLLDFGVETVAWIITGSQSIFLATRQSPALHEYTWADTMQILANLSLNLGQLLDARGYQWRSIE